MQNNTIINVKHKQSMENGELVNEIVQVSIERRNPESIISRGQEIFDLKIHELPMLVEELNKIIEKLKLK